MSTGDKIIERTPRDRYNVHKPVAGIESVFNYPQYIIAPHPHNETVVREVTVVPLSFVGQWGNKCPGPAPQTYAVPDALTPTISTDCHRRPFRRGGRLAIFAFASLCIGPLLVPAAPVHK